MLRKIVGQILEKCNVMNQTTWLAGTNIDTEKAVTILGYRSHKSTGVAVVLLARGGL